MRLTCPRAVLFDLDGTLIDSAPDLIATLMHLRVRHGLRELPPERFRPMATRGAIGLLEAGFAGVQDVEPGALRDDFIDHYRANLWRLSRPFAGIEALLERLAAAGFRLGVVTNKIEALAVPLLEQAGWGDRFGCVIAGDTTARSKPDPEPVLEACRRIGVAPHQAVFVGDDERDMLAGRRAGAITVAAGWGYLPEDLARERWPADAWIERPDELDAILNQMETLVR